MTVYKVIRWYGRRKGSIASWSGTVWYYLSRPVKAPIGRLFAFDTYDNALRFVKSLSPIFKYDIYEAKGTDVKPGRRVAYIRYDPERAIKGFWNGEPVEVLTVPRGTVTCSKIQLLTK